MGFFVRIYMRVCKKMVIYLGIKRKYTWQKNARISCSRNDCKYTWEKTARTSCHNFETNGRPYSLGDFCRSFCLVTQLDSRSRLAWIARKYLSGFVKLLKWKVTHISNIPLVYRSLENTMNLIKKVLWQNLLCCSAQVPCKHWYVIDSWAS